MTGDEIETLVRKAKQQPEGEFHFPDLYGNGWDALPIGRKVAKGNAFLRLVRRGDVPGIEDTGTKAGGGRIYRKKDS
ncbi:DUF1413 domain-containing protein [Tropicimonas sp. IMCC34011]|uniref:DUF1413 domain-containing protein n=1 Tax=Tropicimonas sp. IMCC34011 TaxID=2248759 RepID=UPI000E27A2C6|nr:DUF1413 domain-containing protein [Tropicimonas sp. IMCC34011]